MRATDFVTEIERIHKNDFTGGKEFLKGGHLRTIRKNARKPLPGGSGFQYGVRKRNGRDDLDIRMYDKSGVEPIGSLLLSNESYSFPIKNSYSVDIITVDEDYRNQGIAKSLYGIALTILKLTLLAGSSQTPGGRKNWMSLANIPGVEIKGYVMVPDYKIRTDWETDKDHHDKFDIDRSHRMNARGEERINVLMGKLGGQYMGSYRDEFYFAFDVMPGTGELKPAVKTELSKLYHDEYDMDFITGLYAQWTGA